MGAEPLVQHALEPHAAQEQERRHHRERVVVELRGAEGEHGEPDEHPQEHEEQRAVARGLRPERAAREHASERARQGEHPGEAVETELLDQIDEGAAGSAGVDAGDQPLEVVVDDEALEEGLALVVVPREGEHGEVPGRGDGQDDERPGEQAEAAQAMPLASRDAVHQGHCAGQGETQQTLRQRRQADEAVEGDRPARARLLGEKRDHEAGHRRREQPDEDGVGHGLAREHHEQRRGERGDGAEQGGAARDEAAGGDEQQDGAESGERGEREADAPLGEDAHPAVRAVGVHGEHRRGHQPQVERGLGEEVGRLPPGMEVVAPRDHLARDLAVVRLPGVPEARRAQPRDEEQRGEGAQGDHAALLARERGQPAQPGRLQHRCRQRVAPLRRRDLGDGLGLGCGRVQSRRARHPRPG